VSKGKANVFEFGNEVTMIQEFGWLLRVVEIENVDLA